MTFLDWLIKIYRPRLVKDGGLKPLPVEIAHKIIARRKQMHGDKDSVFMTQNEELASSDRRGGQIVDQPNFDDMDAEIDGYSIQ